MKTLADLKRRLKLALDSDTILVKITIYNTVNGLAFIETPSTKVIKVQSLDFAVDRQGRKSWLAFEKASQWTFEENKAIKLSGQRKAVVEFIADAAEYKSLFAGKALAGA